MAATKPKGAKGPAKQAPKAEPKKESRNDAKKPTDNKAAKEAPKETKAATKNAFGDVPKKGDAKQSNNEAKNNDAPKEAGNDAKQNDAQTKEPDNGAKTPENAPKDTPKDAPADAPKDAPADAPKDDTGANPPADGNPPGDAPPPPDQQPKEPPTGDNKLVVNNGTNPLPQNNLVTNDTPPADGKAAPAPADGKAPPAPAENKTAPTDAGGNISTPIVIKTPFAPQTSNLITENPPLSNTVGEGKPPSAGDGKAAPAPADGKTDPAPADGKTDPAPADGKTDPNAKLPPPVAPQADPKATDNPDVPVTDPEVDTAMNTKDANGKTAQENAQAKTLEDLKKYADEQAKKGEPPDAISKYYKYKLAEQAAKQGLPTGPDPKDPRMPKTTVYQNEKTTGDVFDMDKIKAGVKEVEKDPAVQEFLAKQQKTNVDAEIDKLITEGKIADIPKDPITGSRADYLAAKQKGIINDPKLAEAIAKMPPDKQQEAIAKAVGPLASLGVTVKEAKGELVKVIDGVADITGQPKPAVDENNDFVVTPEGDPVVKDPNSGKNVAMNKEGKVIVDPDTNLPKVIGNDGKVIKDPLNRPVVVAKSGDTVVKDKDGTLLVVGTDKYGNENIPLTNPENTVNNIVIDPATNAPVERDGMTGNIVTDKQTGLANVVDTTTGKALTNPATGNNVVADPESGAAVEVDKTTGKIVTDEAGNQVIVDPKSGYQKLTGEAQPVVVDKESKLPVTIDPKTGIKTVMNPKNAAPLVDPAKGATVVIDPDTKLPIAAVTNKETGEVIKNPNGQIAQVDDETGLPVLVDPKDGTKTIVDPANGYAVQDPKGNTLFVDPTTGLAVAKGADGKDVVENKTGAKLVYDPKTGQPIGKPEFGAYTVIDPKTSLPVEVNAQGNYTVEQATGNVAVMNAGTGQNLTTEDGKVVTIDPKSKLPSVDDGGKTLVVDPANGKYVTSPDTGAKVMVDPNTNMPVYQDPKTGEAYKDPVTGGFQIVDGKTGLPMKDVEGKVVQIDPATNQPAVWNEETGKFDATAPAPIPLLDEFGGQATTPDGNVVAKDGATGNIVVLDKVTKQPITDPKSGLVQVTDADGKPLVDKAGHKIVLDKDSGAPVAVNADGETLADSGGNAKVYNGQTGKQVTDAKGNPVVIDKNSGAPVITDKATGEALKDPATGLPYVADTATGGAVVDKETGNVVVLDKESKAPVLLNNGKIVTDEDGNAVLANARNGKAVTDPNGNQVVVDKNAGVPVVVNKITGTKAMVDGNGNQLTEPKTGAAFEIGKNGMPQAVMADANGNKIVIDPATGKQAEDGNGNKITIDNNTGQMVVNGAAGLIDVFTGKTPVMGDVKNPMPESIDKMFKVIRNSIGSVYWGTFGVAGADFAMQDAPFFKNTTKNFHASRMVASVSGIATMVMAGVRWQDGSKQKQLLDAGNQAAQIQFAEDMATVLKYFGFYPKTVDGIAKYLFDTPKNNAPGYMTMKYDPNAKAVVKTNSGTVHAWHNAGDYNPVTGKIMDKGGFVELPPGTRAEVFVAKGQINPVTGEKATASGWQTLPDGTYDPATGTGAGPRPAPGTAKPGANATAWWNPSVAGGTRQGPNGWERFNANTGKWESGPAVGVPPGKPANYYEPNRPPKFTNTPYTKLAAFKKLTGAISSAANFAMGLGNTVGGGLQLYKGGKQIYDGIQGKNGAQIAEGAFNIIGGTAFTAVGISGMVSAVKTMGTIGAKIAAPIASLISKVASAGNIAGVGLFIGNVATAVAGIIGMARDPDNLKKTDQMWAQAVLNSFDGVDVFKDGPDAAKATLENWYKDWAHQYYVDKQKEEHAGDFSQDGSASANNGFGIIPNGG